MKKIMFNWFSMLLLAFVMSVPYARANVTFNLDVLVNGTSPVGTTPWMTATFEDIAAGQVRLTMTNNMPTYEFIDELVFNSIINPTTLTFANQTLPPPTVNEVFRSSTQSLDGGSQIKAGLFNVFFDYAPPPGTVSDVWSGGLSSVWNITGTGLTSNNFLMQSLDDGNMVGGPYYMAAHVQGIPGITTLSGSIAAVPEPETYAMLLAGLGIMALIVRRRGRNQ